MSRTYNSALIVSSFCFVVLSGLATLQAESLFGVTDSNQLLVIDSETQLVSSVTNIVGLGAGETMIGIDIRPATGELYGYSSADQFYKINPGTGTTLAIGGALGLIDTSQAFDFDPVNDQIRLVTSFRKNIRINPNTGGIISNDALLSYAGGDPNSGLSPVVVQAAHNNNFAGAVSSTLYDLDSAADALTMQTPENAGILNTVGPLGTPVYSLGSFTGMDISGPTGIAYVVGTPLIGGGLSANTLYTVNLGTGQISELGPIQNPAPAPLVDAVAASKKHKHKPGGGVIVDVAAPVGVPEPSTFVLAGCGAVALVTVARRRLVRKK